MASNYGAYGGAANSIFGMFSTFQQISSQNKAIEAEAEFNIAQYKAQETLTKFAQTNNSMRAAQIQSQLESEKTAAIGEVQVEETKAISKETIRRGEGITAGQSVRRSVDSIIKKGAEAKQKTINQYDQQISDVNMQSRDANAREQANLINAYGNMTMKNAQLAGRVITGAQSAMMIAQSGLGAFIQGYGLGEKIGSTITPTKEPIQTNALTQDVQRTSDLLGGNITYENINNPFNKWI